MSVAPVNNNIADIVLDILAVSRYGIKCKSNTEPKLQLMQIMANEMDCDIKNVVCLPKEKTCCDDTVAVICNLNINPSIEYEDQGEGILYILATIDSGASPFTVSWVFDTDLFELAPGETGTSLTLYLKWLGALPIVGDTIVTLTVTDAKGCVDIQSFELEFQ